MKILILALCVVVVAAAKKECSSGDDCEADECCATWFIHSRCTRLREEGESCTWIEKKQEEKPDKYAFQCPCKAGMECKAQYEIEVFGHVIRHKPECVKPDGDGDDGGEIGEPEAE